MAFAGKEIAHTLGVKLMVMQAELLAGRANPNAEDWDSAFDQLMHGPEAQLLSSIWSRVERREFQRYMMNVRANIKSQVAMRA